ncbi:hypothetical protein MLD38_020789 [Melastoma candidum]|uniref:Uncharacterized protein n=1 Tax=Melastoma candidum TaxID=119954 RepID=A0ACB9QFA3_9MYRT|nr:hypothetical protein MLD38_020789 [Melastoma candidum]
MLHRECNSGHLPKANLGDDVQDTNMGNLSTIQHPCHDHSLTKLLVPSSPYSFKCYLCNEKLKHWSYQCYKCNFHIHEHCAEAQPTIPSHPLHPQHPLVLSHGIQHHFVCEGCHVHPWSRIAYSCKECDIYLDFPCAVSTLPWKEGEAGMPGQGLVPARVQYFVHEHPLMCFDAESGTGDYCWVCKEEIQGEGCGCFVCKLFLHSRCLALMRPRTEYEGELPIEEARETNESSVVIEHPLHGQHQLYLFIGRVLHDCYACKSFCRSSWTGDDIYCCYVCDQCHFGLDIRCAMTMQSKLVAHIECALSKSVVMKNDRLVEKVDERIVRLRREADEAKAKLEATMAELEEAERERSAPPY